MTGKRFLFVVPPLAGHINPARSVAAGLLAHGHEVAFVGPEQARSFVTVSSTDSRAKFFDTGRADLRERPAGARGFAALKFLWEEFIIPLAVQMQAGVEASVAEFRPDVLVVDHQAFAGALVARRRRLPFASFVTTSVSLVDPLSEFPKVKEWRDAQLHVLEREIGLEPQPRPDLSRDLVVVFSSQALVCPKHELGREVRFVGPAIAGRPEEVPFPFERLSPSKTKVLVSLGTVSHDAGARFFGAISEALAGMDDVQAILVATPETIASPPPDAIVQPFVPQLRLLEHVSLVVCHAGHNTVCEALDRGLPLVLAPIRDDQPVVAEQVLAAGAGVRVKFGRASATTLRDAIAEVLRQPRYREAAAQIRASFDAARAESSPVTLVEDLA